MPLQISIIGPLFPLLLLPALAIPLERSHAQGTSPSCALQWPGTCTALSTSPHHLLAAGADSRARNDPTDSASAAPAEVSGQDAAYFYEPFPMKPGRDLFQLGASFSLLSYQDAEQELPIPGLDIQYKRGLLDNVALVASFSTSYFSNLLHAGIQWNTRLETFSYGLATHLGGAYGFVRRENLYDDVEGYAIFGMVILRLGYRFDEFSLSCSFVSSYVMNSRSYVNGMEASIGPQNTVNDYYCTLVVEQPLLKTLRLSIGFSLGYARTPYHTWMLYDTVDEWLFVPEFFFAVQL